MSAPPLPRIDIFAADFLNLRWNGDLYVDKTCHFRHLLEGDHRRLFKTHQFFAHPRRFGKSLLLSTMSAWFQGIPPEHAAAGEGRGRDFGQPVGWANPAWLWEGLDGGDWHGAHGWHPVLHLDLATAVDLDPDIQRRKLQEHLWNLANTWEARGVAWPARQSPFATEQPAEIFRRLIAGLNGFRSAPMVLIDEYDAPLTLLIGTSVDTLRVETELRDLFRVLKDSASDLYGVFVAGITRFARDSLFSAANNMLDITEWPACADLCGFTSAEVAMYLAPYMERLTELEPAFRNRALQDEWERFYNGYRMAPAREAPAVSNPYTLLYAVHETMGNPAARRRAAAGRWPEGWSRTGHPAFAARLLLQRSAQLPVPGRAGLRRGTGGTLREPPPTALMQDTGYLTWTPGSKAGDWYLDYPNNEVFKSFHRNLLEEWCQPESLNLEHVERMRTALATDNPAAFAATLEHFCFGMAHRNLKDEPTARVLLQVLCNLMTERSVAEKSNWGGDSDLEIELDGRGWVIEAKWNHPTAVARRQVEKRGYGRGGPLSLPVQGLALAFRKTPGRTPYIEHETWVIHEPDGIESDNTETGMPPPAGVLSD